MLQARWRILALIFAFAFTGYVQRNGISIAAERMMPELGLTQVQVGWLLTAFLFTYAVFQIPGALLGQRIGGRVILALIGLATALASLGTAFGKIFVVLLAARALLGVAQGGLFPVGAGMIRAWFPVNRWASAQALVVTGLWSGAAATPALVAWLMQTYDWRTALIITSVPSLVLVALWYWYARDRPDQHSAVSAEELSELTKSPTPHSPLPGSLRRVLSDQQILLITASYFVMNYVFYLVTFWSFLYLVQARGMTVLESGLLAVLPFIAAGIAAGVGGRLADRFGMRIVPLVALPLAALFMYLTVTAASPYWAVAFLCLGFGCIELTEGSYWGATMRRAPNDTMTATAVLNTGGNLGGVVATPIIAAMSSSYSWTVVFATGAVCALVAAGVWLTVRS
jgi:ACS family glucarate transporter-like MFS transporter